MADSLFFVGVSLLLMHEMDAIDKEEWRLMFVLRKLPRERALRWFITLHFPIFVGLLFLVAAGPSATTRWVEGGVDLFLIVHAVLHENLSRTGDESFANSYSHTVILSAAAFAVAHLVYLLV